MRFDMRAPDFGAPATDLDEAAIDMCEWAQTRGWKYLRYVDKAVMPAMQSGDT